MVPRLTALSEHFDLDGSNAVSKYILFMLSMKVDSLIDWNAFVTISVRSWFSCYVLQISAVIVNMPIPRFSVRKVPLD